MTDFRKLSLQLLGTLLLSGMLVGAQAAEVTQDSIQSEQHNFRLVRLASKLHHPWASALLPDGRFLVTERRGRIALIEDGTVTYLDGVPAVSAQGQGGLLDLVLHPKYGDGKNDWIYFTYSRPGEGGTATALARARLEGKALVGLQELFAQDRYSSPGQHYGSRLAWRRDGTLMMTVGERSFHSERAQDKRDHAGSVLRLTETGGAPKDNPFFGKDEGLDEIYSYGHRNTQGLAVAADDSVWVSEHGPLTGDELNLIEAGVNYGWPRASRGNDYRSGKPIGVKSLPDMRDAQYIYSGRFAPSGLTQVNSEYFPKWSGNLLAGGLLSEQLQRLVIRDGKVIHTEKLLSGEISRIRDIRQGADGYIYLLNDRDDGGLYRIEPAG